MRNFAGWVNYTTMDGARGRVRFECIKRVELVNGVTEITAVFGGTADPMAKPTRIKEQPNTIMTRIELAKMMEATGAVEIGSSDDEDQE